MKRARLACLSGVFEMKLVTVALVTVIGCNKGSSNGTRPEDRQDAISSVRGNLITSLRTESEAGEPTILAMVEIGDAASLESCVPDIIHRLLLQRMMSPPETTAIRLTIIGAVSAKQFASLWQKHLPAEPAMAFFMSSMRSAEVVHSTPYGGTLDRASLLKPAAR